MSAALLRRLSQAGEAGTFAIVRPEDRRVPDAEQRARVSASLLAMPTMDEGVAVRHGRPVSTAKGIAVPLFGDDRQPRKSRSVWLDDWLGSLDAAGLPSRLGTSGLGVYNPASLGLPMQSTAPAAFIGYRVGRYPPRTDRLRGWLLDPADTRILADRTTGWAATHPIRQTWLGTAWGDVNADPTDTATFLEDATSWSPMGKFVTMVDAQDQGFHRVTWGDMGVCVAQSLFHHHDWRHHLSLKIQHLLLAPELTDTGFIKNVEASISDFMQATVRDLHPTVRDPYDYECNRHLWDQHVIDAAGVQLLTGKHLAHARDLHDWAIEEVAPDRYLVSARDLAPWYAGHVAEPDTITKARHDFGDMILTWDAILANPGPWTITDARRIGL